MVDLAEKINTKEDKRSKERENKYVKHSIRLKCRNAVRTAKDAL